MMDHAPLRKAGGQDVKLGVLSCSAACTLEGPEARAERAEEELHPLRMKLVWSDYPRRGAIHGESDECDSCVGF